MSQTTVYINGNLTLSVIFVQFVSFVVFLLYFVLYDHLYFAMKQSLIPVLILANPVLYACLIVCLNFVLFSCCMILLCIVILPLITKKTEKHNIDIA